MKINLLGKTLRIDKIEEMLNSVLDIDLLKGKYKKISKNNPNLHPTWGHCYVVSELIYHENTNLTPYYVKMKKEDYPSMVSDTTHWFLLHGSNIIDLTSKQFGDIEIPYKKGKRASFLTKHLSKRGVQLKDKLKKLIDQQVEDKEDEE